MRVGVSAWLCVLSVTASASCGGSGPICDGAALTSALASAGPGSVVMVGACRVEGRFTVPAGVTLRGQGAVASTIASPGTAIIVDGDDVTIDDLTVANGTGHGIVAIGHDHVTIRNVTVTATLGRAALGFQDVPTLVLDHVVASGPVTDANATTVPVPPTEASTALYGVVLEHVGSATMTSVDASGFGAGGVVMDASTAAWTTGTVTGNLGLGVWVNGGSATLDHVGIANTLRGFRLTPTFGLASSSGATVHTTACTIADTQGGFGAFHDGGVATHDGLVATSHVAGALLAQRTTSLVVSNSTFMDNDFAGIITVQASGVSIHDTTIMTTHASVRTLHDWGTVMVGDGIQVVTPMPGTSIQNVTLAGNERAGLLFDLGGGDTATFTLGTANITATGTELGCVMQNGTGLPGWDDMVVRNTIASTNDAAFSSTLDVAGIIGPVDLPNASSLTGIIGPVD